MRTYIAVTGVLFALLVVVHIARAVAEGAHVAREPSFLISTLLGVGMCAWAVRLWRQSKH